MWLIASLAGGAIITQVLKETDTAIPVFLGLCLFIFLLFTWPPAAWTMFIGICVITVVLGIIAFWESILGWALGIGLFTLLMLGFLASTQPYSHDDAYMFHECHQTEACE
jgi:hypothetical protein